MEKDENRVTIHEGVFISRNIPLITRYAAVYTDALRPFNNTAVHGIMTAGFPSRHS